MNEFMAVLVLEKRKKMIIYCSIARCHLMLCKRKERHAYAHRHTARHSYVLSPRILLSFSSMDAARERWRTIYRHFRFRFIVLKYNNFYFGGQSTAAATTRAWVGIWRNSESDDNSCWSGCSSIKTKGEPENVRGERERIKESEMRLMAMIENNGIFIFIYWINDYYY